MSDAYFFDASSPQELQRRIDEFVRRCEIIERQIFRKNEPDVGVFRSWLNDLISKSENTFWILHEDPFYLVAEYNGADVRVIENTKFASEYNELARNMGWIE